MVQIQPFSAVRPRSDLAASVASVPYDVVNAQEARREAGDNPHSFMRVVRSEVGLEPGVDPYDERVYTQARIAYRSLRDEGVLCRDERPGMYLYRQSVAGHSQTGLVCCCHIDEYEANVVRRHEKTRRVKEDDRTRHILSISAQAGPVFCTYRDDQRVEKLVQRDVTTPPVFHFEAADGVTHTGWTVADNQAYREAFAAMEAVYIADGHHRAASAWRAGAARREADAPGDDHEWFLVALFPAGEVNILPYNRVVTDLGGRSPEEVLAALGDVGDVRAAPHPEPSQPGSFTFYLGDRWQELSIPTDTIDHEDPVRSLDAALLQERVLEPVLGIKDLRNDPRIEFVGGVRGTRELARRVDAGEAAIGFALFATSVEQLLRVADGGLEMPPKSTWFEPKLRSGLFVHEIVPAAEPATP